MADFKIEVDGDKDEIAVNFGEAGRKLDGLKPRFSLLPWGSISEAVRVLEFGAVKYDVDNWKRVQDAEKRYWDAAIRHLVAIREGETRDPESGLYHFAHALCCILFLGWFQIRKDVE